MHAPQLAETSHERKETILWNQKVQSDRTIPKNQQNIIIHDNEKRTYMLLHVVISGDRHVIEKLAEKILKQKDFTREVYCIQNVKTKVTPVITGAT
jgi:hypothetical protein